MNLPVPHFFALFAAVLIFRVPTNALPPPVPPNIVLMVGDDLGYGDLGCYGATAIATPRIDSLAKDGVRFTDAHSYSGICMPSRYTLLSGRYAFRVNRSMAEYACHFDDGQVLLPGALKAAGYRTAMLGKWHNGFGRGKEPDWNAELKPGPLEFGFDSFFGMPRTHSEPPLVFVRDHAIVGLETNDPISVDRSPGTGAHGKQIGGINAMKMRPTDQIDLRLAKEAEQFITSAKNQRGQPFFLYIAWAAPHNPLSPSAEFKGISKAGVYGDFIQQLDHSVGVVLDALAKHGLADNTLVLLTSDNGGRFESGAARARHRPNGPLLGQKTDAWEGGHRVPLLARWPMKIPSGTERHHYFHQVDIMATLVDAAGATLPEGASPDGHSELPGLLDPASPAIRAEGIHHGTTSLALRSGSWIYIPAQGSGGKTAPEPARPFGLPYAKMGFINSDVDSNGQIKSGAPREQLYDLSADLSEKNNLAPSEPEKLKTLRGRFGTLTKGATKGKGDAAE
jgi:arylsulfatase A-like enzyme